MSVISGKVRVERIFTTFYVNIFWMCSLYNCKVLVFLKPHSETVQDNCFDVFLALFF